MNTPEILRYLGYRAAPPDEATLALIARCYGELETCAAPAHVLQHVALAVDDAGVTIEDARTGSADLAAHLKGCAKGYLLAATLGAGADRLLVRLGKTDISAAAVTQACAAAMLEDYCDEVQAGIDAKHLTSRFSPGYGDFPLSFQQTLLNMLSAHKKIGLTCTSHFMLTPVKSVTAVIGVTDAPRKNCAARCAGCDKQDCLFRRSQP